jgi:hypothetical protein
VELTDLKNQIKQMAPQEMEGLKGQESEMLMNMVVSSPELEPAK